MRIAIPIVTAVVLLAAASGEASAEEEAPPPMMPAPARKGPRAGVALSASYGVVNSHHAQIFRSLELDAVSTLGGKTHFGVVAGIAEGISNPIAHGSDTREHTYYDHAYWDVWFGPQVGWGAPFRPTARWGVSLKAGMIGGTRDVTLYSGFRNDDPARYLSGFGAVAVRLALCTCTSVRPFVGGSGRWVLSHYGDSVQSAGIDLGLAFAP